jgi:hypothetical protein
MNQPINQIVNGLNNSLYPMFQSRVPVGSSTDSQVDIQETSHKYRIENKLIVYEKYDHHGKLISRVPWLHKPVDEKA